MESQKLALAVVAGWLCAVPPSWAQERQDYDLGRLARLVAARNERISPIKWSYEIHHKRSDGEEYHQITALYHASGGMKRHEIVDHEAGLVEVKTWDGLSLVVKRGPTEAPGSLEGVKTADWERSLVEGEAFDHGKMPFCLGVTFCGLDLAEILRQEGGAEYSGRRTILGVDCAELILLSGGELERRVVGRAFIDDTNSLLVMRGELVSALAGELSAIEGSDGFAWGGRAYGPTFAWEVTEIGEVNGVPMPKAGRSTAPGVPSQTEYYRYDYKLREMELGEGAISAVSFTQVIPRGAYVVDQNTGARRQEGGGSPEGMTAGQLRLYCEEIRSAAALPPLESNHAVHKQDVWLDLSCGVTAGYLYLATTEFRPTIEVFKGLFEGAANSKQEVSIAQIQDALREIGAATTSYRGTMGDVREVPGPCILHFPASVGGGGHFAAAYTHPQGSITIFDPLHGKETYTGDDSREVNLLVSHEAHESSGWGWKGPGAALLVLVLVGGAFIAIRARGITG